MRPRAFAVFAGLTVIMTAAAVWAVSTQRAPTSIAADRARVFPALADRLNDAAEVRIVSNKADFTMKKLGSADEWGLVEKGNHKVVFDKVKAALVRLSDLKYFEGKTSDPDRYARLEVEDPKSSVDARGKRIVVKDGDGTVLADAVVGKLNRYLFGGSGGGTYVRKAGDGRVWLAEGELEFGREPIEWLFRDLVNILEEDVKRLEIRQPDGSVLIAHKNKGEKDMKVANIPEGRKLKSDSEANPLATGMWRLIFEDVEPAERKKFPDTFVVSDYWDFDGFHARAEIAHIGEEYWARFHAIDDTAKDADEETKKKVAERVKKLNARYQGWVYRLSAGEGERLSTKMEELLAEPKKGAT